MPSVLGIGVGYGEGGLDPMSDDRVEYETDRWWVMPYLEWHLQEKANHKDDRDDARRLEMAIVTGRLQPLSEESSDEVDPTLSLEAFGLGPPEDVEDAWKKLIYAVTIVVVVLALGLANWFGIPIPGMGKLPRRNGRPSKQETQT